MSVEEAREIEVITFLYPKIKEIVDASKVLETDPSANTPSSDNIPGTGSGSGDADPAALVTLASWDFWTLDSDLSVKFAVDNGINTADTFQLGLRKHAINCKLLAQAQAEAVKAGQQYVQAAVEVVIYQRDVERPRHSLPTTKGNAMYVLEPSAEYKQDRLLIMEDIDNADSTYATDDQKFEYHTPSSKLLLEGLRSAPDYKASCTLSPNLDAGGKRSFAAEFTDGAHYRLEETKPTLRSAIPRLEKPEDDKVVMSLRITPSGLY
ncbi:hypothetical protein F5Y10DRAFT_289831 [Nemania abortiva]|nr:hypothetical protein F5Y10DRAFT_289831 [Nemania abortiva]